MGMPSSFSHAGLIRLKYPSNPAMQSMSSDTVKSWSSSSSVMRRSRMARDKSETLRRSSICVTTSRLSAFSASFCSADNSRGTRSITHNVPSAYPSCEISGAPA